MWKNILLPLLVLCSLKAQTNINGNVQGTWDIQGSPYQLTGNTMVSPTDTLIIQRGVQVDLGVTYDLLVQGVLIAEGALLTGSGSLRGDHGVLSLLDCRFPNLLGGIDITGGMVWIQGCQIDGSAESGISLSHIDSGYVRDSQVWNSGDYGIKVAGSDQVEITGNLLEGNSTNDLNHPALFIDSCSPIHVSQNIIQDNHAQGLGVWSLSATAAPQITNNLIRRNFTGITVVNSPAHIQDNIIVANYQQGNFNSGAGIYIGYAESAGIIMGNYIGGNYYGVSIINEARPNLGDMVNDYPGDDGLNLFNRNSYDGNTWHIWNGTPNFIMAQNNHWLDIERSAVDTTLYDDEEGNGEVIYEPIYADPLPAVSDLSQDGDINILDVVLLLEHILTTESVDPVLFYLCDTNMDYQVNVGDVVALIEALLQ